MEDRGLESLSRAPGSLPEPSAGSDQGEDAPPVQSSILDPRRPEILDPRSAAPAPLVEELTPDPDPWDVCRRLAGLPRLLFLDSASPHPALGRYSFVTADPF